MGDTAFPIVERERRLQVLYHGLYGNSQLRRLPECPIKNSAVWSGTEQHIEMYVNNLRLSLEEALAQAETQTHPGAFLLLTCHLNRPRRLKSRSLAALTNFPWLTLGLCLLVLGLVFGGMTDSDR